VFPYPAYQLNEPWHAAAAGWVASAGAKVGRLWQKLSWMCQLMVVLVRICFSLACICEPAIGDWNVLDGLWGCPFGSKVCNGPFASMGTVKPEVCESLWYQCLDLHSQFAYGSSQKLTHHNAYIQIIFPPF